MSIMKQRDNRLKTVLSNDIDDDMLLLKSKKMSMVDWQKIYDQTEKYIKNTIVEYHKSYTKQEIDSLSLDELNSLGLIHSLSSMTPNGILLPKKETIYEHEILQLTIAESLCNMGIHNHITKIHYPVTVRIVYNKKGELDKKPRASSKIHTDVWSGEATNTTMVFIPIHGDFSNVGVNFYETPDEIVNWLRPLDDYNDGAEIANIARNKKYNTILKAGYIYLSDPLLLHSTNKSGHTINNSPWRISIDFRFISDIKCEYDSGDNPRAQNYIDYKEWSSVGQNIRMCTDSSLFDVFNVNPNDKAKNEYPGKYYISRKQ